MDYLLARFDILPLLQEKKHEFHLEIRLSFTTDGNASP